MIVAWLSEKANAINITSCFSECKLPCLSEGKRSRNHHKELLIGLSGYSDKASEGGK